MFNSLTSYDAVHDAVVVDLFAGSGALGIEALSRGASCATFVERDGRARAVIDANLAATGLADHAAVVGGTAEDHLARTSESYDVVLADPPYEYSDWGRLLGLVAPRLSPRALVVIESGGAVDLPDGWGVVRAKSYGGTLVTFVSLTTTTTPPTSPSPSPLPTSPSLSSPSEQP